VNADADHVARLDMSRVERVEHFVDQLRIAVRAGRRRRQHVQPPGRHQRDAE